MEKQNENNDVPMDPLFDILTGPVKMAVLEAALELNIADVTENAISAQGIAGALGIHTDPQGLGFFLDSMAAMGFLEKQDGTYRNTSFAQRYLHSQSPLYMKPFVTRMKSMQHKNLDRITGIIRNGPPKVEKFERLASETKWEKAVAHLAAYQRAGMAGKAADLVQARAGVQRRQKTSGPWGRPGTDRRRNGPQAPEP